MESAGSAGSWCFQHQCVEGVFKQNKENKDGLLHGLIRWALALPGGFLAGEATEVSASYG